MGAGRKRLRGSVCIQLWHRFASSRVCVQCTACLEMVCFCCCPRRWALETHGSCRSTDTGTAKPNDPSTCGAEAASGKRMHPALAPFCIFSRLRSMYSMLGDGLFLLLSSSMGPGNTWVLSQHGHQHSLALSRRMRRRLDVVSHQQK